MPGRSRRRIERDFYAGQHPVASVEPAPVPQWPGAEARVRFHAVERDNQFRIRGDPAAGRYDFGVVSECHQDGSCGNEHHQEKSRKLGDQAIEAKGGKNRKI